jgi:hypothetical protein
MLHYLRESRQAFIPRLRHRPFAARYPPSLRHATAFWSVLEFDVVDACETLGALMRLLHRLATSFPYTFSLFPLVVPLPLATNA